MADELLRRETWLRKALSLGQRVLSAYQRARAFRRLPLHQRHQDIIERTKRSMVLNNGRRHYLDDLTAQCVRDIAVKEGKGKIAPHAGEWLWRWRARAGVPNEYLELALVISSRLRDRYTELQYAEQEVQRSERERRYERYEDWFSQNRSVVDRFLEVSDRKVSQLDDYGDENWDALPKEIQTCLLKLARTESNNDVTDSMIKEALKKGYDWMLPEKYQWLKARLESEFRKFHEQRAHSAVDPAFDELSGVEFETYLARLLTQNGFEDIRGTAATGDQGADLIARKSDRTIVIQAKRYRGTVGNKAVQEVVAAVKFYQADEAWVITSGTFTPSARALAKANGVTLIDGYALRNGCFE